LRVGSSAVYLFLDGIFGLGFGYVFWIVVSRILGSSVTGETASSIILAVLFASIFTFGISIGSQRFLGIAFADKNPEYFREVAKFMILFSIACMAIVTIVIIAFEQVLIDVFEISSEMIFIIIITTISYALSVSLRGIFVSSLNTKKILIIFIISNVIRFLTLIPTFILELGTEGIALAYASFYLSATLLMIFSARTHLFGKTIHKGFEIFSEKKQIVRASVSGWIPGIISTIGTQSGILFIFGITGAAEAGVYYMAFGVYLAIFALPQSVLHLLFPILSGMIKGRENLLWKAILFSFYIIGPISIAIAFFPKPILSIFGPDFISGSLILTLLVISILPTVILRSINFLSFAYGRYREVLILGIITNVIQVTLFILLVTDYGGEGIAISILIGALSGFAVSLIINKAQNYMIPGKKISLLLGISAAIGFITYLVNLDQVLSIFIVILGSFVLIPRIGIIKYSEVEEILNSIFVEEKNISKKLLSWAKIFFK